MAGRHALSWFDPIEHGTLGAFSVTLMRVRIATGRTHQIRVHAAEAGHPLAGDPKYGERPFNRVAREAGLNRLFLHAARLRLPESVTGRPLEIAAPLPAELTTVLVTAGITPPRR